jgi:hypothetical protein
MCRTPRSWDRCATPSGQRASPYPVLLEVAGFRSAEGTNTNDTGSSGNGLVNI